MLAQTYGGVAALVGSLDDVSMTRLTRCAGWAVGDVVVHLLADAQRALIACATPVEARPTVEDVSYWSAWRADHDPAQAARAARFVRIQASAYSGPAGLLTHWRDTSEAVARAVAAHDPAQRVATQGQVMTVGSLERTLVVEAVVHHLDCLLELPSAPRPAIGPLAVARETCSDLAGVQLPEAEQWVLRAAGRLPLTADDRVLLGAAAERFPVLG